MSVLLLNKSMDVRAATWPDVKVFDSAEVTVQACVRQREVGRQIKRIYEVNLCLLDQASDIKNHTEAIASLSSEKARELAAWLAMSADLLDEHERSRP